MADELPPKAVEGSGPGDELPAPEFPAADETQTGVDQFDTPNPPELPSFDQPSSPSPSPSTSATPTASPSVSGSPVGSEVVPTFSGNGYTFISPGVSFGTMTPGGEKHPGGTGYSYFNKGTRSWMPVQTRPLGEIGPHPQQTARPAPRPDRPTFPMMQAQ